MRKREEKVLLLCDEEEEYAQAMSEYLKKKKNLPWHLRTYTSGQEMLRQEKEPVNMLVVAESTYEEAMQKLSPDNVVILNESGRILWENLHYVDKYDCAEEVVKQLLLIYADGGDRELPRLLEKKQVTFLGNYSPVRRCFQTSFALTLGQLLAEEHRTLYLNFEHYAGLGELLPKAQQLDMADLLYFLNTEKEKFRIRMRTMVQQLGNLDYIPPMRAGQNLLAVTAEEWTGLLEKIEDLGEYEYVILDLSESMQGLFDILRKCKKVFTSVGKDRMAERKLTQYEQLLALSEYEDVLEKTEKLDLTEIHRLPEELEQLTRGELAEVAKKIAVKLEEE